MRTSSDLLDKAQPCENIRTPGDIDRSRKPWHF
jgi:hypothetical protein